MATTNNYSKKSNAWRSLFMPGKPLSEGFIFGVCRNCGFISIEAVEDGEQQDDGASPANGNKVDKALAETIKNKLRGCLKLEDKRPKPKKQRTATASLTISSNAL